MIGNFGPINLGNLDFSGLGGFFDPSKVPTAGDLGRFGLGGFPAPVGVAPPVRIPAPTPVAPRPTPVSRRPSAPVTSSRASRATPKPQPVVPVGRAYTSIGPNLRSAYTPTAPIAPPPTG